MPSKLLGDVAELGVGADSWVTVSTTEVPPDTIPGRKSGRFHRAAGLCGGPMSLRGGEVSTLIGS